MNSPPYNREEVTENIKKLLKGYADSNTDIEITVRGGTEADVFLDGKKFNTYDIAKKKFMYNIPKPVQRQDEIYMSVIIARDDLMNKYESYKGADLQLPATVNEIKDALQRARITSNGEPYSILECIIYDDDILPKLKDGPPSLDKLNYLAMVMSEFKRQDHELYRGVMNMIPESDFTIKSLINGAYNLEGSSLINDLKNDAELGKIYADNGWIEWLKGADEAVFKYIDYEALGRDIREKEGGIYTQDGYFVKSKNEYVTLYDGENFPETFEKDEYIFKLRISKKPSESEPNDSSEKWITLPVSKEGKMAFLRTLRAESYDDCILIAVRSMEEHIPMCIKDLSQLGQLNSLAHRMRDMEKTYDLAKFKAILSAMEIKTLEDVIYLANDMDRYILYPEPSSMEEYARIKFKQKVGDRLSDDELKFFDFFSYGELLRSEGNVKHTEYGILETPTHTGKQMEMEV